MRQRLIDLFCFEQQLLHKFRQLFVGTLNESLNCMIWSHFQRAKRDSAQAFQACAGFLGDSTSEKKGPNLSFWSIFFWGTGSHCFLKKIQPPKGLAQGLGDSTSVCYRAQISLPQHKTNFVAKKVIFRAVFSLFNNSEIHQMPCDKGHGSGNLWTLHNKGHSSTLTRNMTRFSILNPYFAKIKMFR